MTTPSDEKLKQIADFVEEFVDRINWMTSPDAASVLLNKYSNDGSVNYANLISWFIMYALDQGQEHGMSGPDLHSMISNACLIFSSTSFDDDIRAALRPLYKDK